MEGASEHECRCRGLCQCTAASRAQLQEIVRVVPAKAVAELQKVPLWINPEYPKVHPRAEYHPDAGWLRDNGRDPVMAKGGGVHQRAHL
jgi:hypothetical protein